MINLKTHKIVEDLKAKNISTLLFISKMNAKYFSGLLFHLRINQRTLLKDFYIFCDRILHGTLNADVPRIFTSIIVDASVLQ